MFADVAVKIPRGPVRDVDGVLVRALRYDVGLSLMDFASRIGKEKVTVYRWEIGGIDEVMWRGLLSIFDRPAAWMPPQVAREKAQAELAELRAAQAERDHKKPKRR